MELPPQRRAEVAWLRPVGARVLKWWPAKMIGTTLGMTVFFVAYFWLLRHPLHPPVIMPLTVVDRWIGFRPAAVILYISLWFYVSLAPALVIDRRELISYLFATVGLSVAGLAVFFLWPTAVPRPEVDWSLYPSFALLKAVDASGNACPSLHVAFAIFTAAWFDRLGRQIGAGRVVRVANWLWCLGILYSTIAIRQHVFLDVVAGAALGAAAAAAHFSWLARSPDVHGGDKSRPPAA